MEVIGNIISQGGNLIYQGTSLLYRQSRRRESTLSFMEKLNRIDDIRNKLLPMKKEKSFEDIFSNIPQFIVVGPQSSGKSSVLRRITGIHLPTSSGVCTRVPVVIKLRMGAKLACVDLIHPDGSKQTFENSSNPENISRAIQQAQQRFKDKGEFGKDFIIDVLYQDMDKPNITLVDLPGFTNSSDENTKIVNEMVKKYLDMDGTLVLHIVRADQDFDSLLGNDFIRKHKNDKVLVLTHCDSLEEQGIANYTQRMNETLSKDIEHVFAVIASKSLEEMNNENEIIELSKFNSITSRDKIKLGTKNLNEFIEKKMEQHLENQIPLLRDFIEEMKMELIEKLGAYDEQAPQKALVETLNTLRNRFQGKVESYENKFRLNAEDLKDELLDLEVFNQEAIGMTCIQDVYGKSPKYQYVDLGKVKEYIQKIKDMSDNRGMINVGHMNKQMFIERFACEFADMYKPVLINTKDKIFNDVKKDLEECFNFEPSPLAVEFVRKLKQEFFKEYTDDDAIKAIDHLVLYNKPPLVFTLNDHYLNQAYADMTENVRFDNDCGAYLEIIYRVNAYIKVTRKVLIDTSFKELYITILKKSTDSYELMLTKLFEKHIPLIKLPREMLVEKVKLEKQFEIVSNVLSQLNEM